MKRFESYVNKRIGFSFSGEEMSFFLSHALFSSFDVDQGTRLLLKTIARRIDLTKARSALDVGCGVGVLGICVNRKAPHLRTLMQDRDALAAAFSRENCVLNGCPNIEVQCGLALWHLDGREFDLVLSNLPAKAGEPVLRSFFRNVPAALAADGTAAIVVVAPLAAFALTTIESLGHQVTHEESTGNHTVVHFKAPAVRRGFIAPAVRRGFIAPAVRRGFLSAAGKVDTGIPLEDLSPYIREKKRFTCAGVSYELETAFGIPSFDTLGYPLELSMSVLSTTAMRGELLFWNPGQGHIPVALCTKARKTISGISLCGRDSLELETSARNLRNAGMEPRTSLALPSESGLAEALPRGSIDLLCVLPVPIPRVDWQEDVVDAAAYLLREGGRLLVTGRSTEIRRLLEGMGGQEPRATRRGFRLLQDRKHRGHRALLFQAL